MLPVELDPIPPTNRRPVAEIRHAYTATAPTALTALDRVYGAMAQASDGPQTAQGR